MDDEYLSEHDNASVISEMEIERLESGFKSMEEEHLESNLVQLAQWPNAREVEYVLLKRTAKQVSHLST